MTVTQSQSNAQRRFPYFVIALKILHRMRLCRMIISFRLRWNLECLEWIVKYSDFGTPWHSNDCHSVAIERTTKIPIFSDSSETSASNASVSNDYFLQTSLEPWMIGMDSQIFGFWHPVTLKWLSHSRNRTHNEDSHIFWYLWKFYIESICVEGLFLSDFVGTLNVRKG